MEKVDSNGGRSPFALQLFSDKATIMETLSRQQLDLDYFVHWRPYLWREPVRRMLNFLGDLHGKRLLHIGDTPGRMTSYFAMSGAYVTLADPNPVDTRELAKWGIREKVNVVTTNGSLAQLGDARFDLAVTKSVLWQIPDLKVFLEEIAEHLRPGAKVAFIENTYGSPVTAWLRRHVSSRLAKREDHRFGIKRSQLPLFQQQFDRISIRSRFRLVYEIHGYARDATSAGKAG